MTNLYGTEHRRDPVVPAPTLPSLSLVDAEAYRRTHRCPHGVCGGALFVNADRDDVYNLAGTLDCTSCSRTVANVRMKEHPTRAPIERPKPGRPRKVLP